MAEPDVLIDYPETAIGRITLNRPEARNALNMNVRRLLAEAFSQLGQDEAVRAIILTGGSKVFAAGADLKELEPAGAIEMMLRKTHLYWQTIAECPKPVIAAVAGFALGGGCELAMHADIILAGESASLGQPEIRVGVMPGAGGTQRLVRAVGKFQAMRLLLTGKPVAAREALAIGLVSAVVPDAELMDQALAMARDIAQLPPLAAMQIKEAVLAGADASLSSALMLERKAFQLLFASADKNEGMQAFLAKRKPIYQGK
ncbi:MAG: enoyl-CoA hydratase/isomerase family protein [Rhodospirillales bacterium]|nr:enoyl-CoA hydratase/isomerase family protein [Rhodospirillales bacterium]